MVIWVRLIFIGVVLLGYLGIHMLIKDRFYKKYGFDLNFFNVKTAIIISLIMFFTLPYIGNGIKRMNDFEIVIGEDFTELDFSDLYDQIYDKVNVKGELYATVRNIPDSHSIVREVYFRLSMENQNKIDYLNMHFFTRKCGKWVSYFGRYENGVLYFTYNDVFSTPIDEVYKGTSNLKDLMYEWDKIDFDHILMKTETVKNDRYYHSQYPTTGYLLTFQYAETGHETTYPEGLYGGGSNYFHSYKTDSEGRPYVVTETYLYQDAEAITKIDAHATFIGHTNSVGVYYYYQFEENTTRTAEGLLVYVPES
jgi:hypothetical protein